MINRINLDKDDQAMIDFLALFEEDMNELSRFMRIPKEDAIQSLKLGMLELISKCGAECLEGITNQGSHDDIVRVLSQQPPY